MGTIVAKVSTSGAYTCDTARAKQHKDRYSSLAMAVRYAEIEEARKRLLAGRMGGGIGVVTRM